MRKTQNAFTLVELLISMGIFSVISVASVWLVFLSLSLRDLSSATSKTEESLRIFNHTFRQASQNASSVSGGGNSILMKTATECWSFVYDGTVKKIKYDHTIVAGCNPNPTPTNLFFPTMIVVDNFVFNVSPLSTGGRQINATGKITSVLPFNSFSENFSATVANVID